MSPAPNILIGSMSDGNAIQTQIVCDVRDLCGVRESVCVCVCACVCRSVSDGNAIQTQIVYYVRDLCDDEGDVLCCLWYDTIRVCVYIYTFTALMISPVCQHVIHNAAMQGRHELTQQSLRYT
jgi:hypothetical protein